MQPPKSCSTPISYSQSTNIDSASNFKVVLFTTFTCEPENVIDSIFKNYTVDSMLNHYITFGILPNKYILNHRILTHAYGADSRKAIFECEIDRFENIPKADALTTELIDKSFKNEKDKKHFWKAWAMIFDRHEDSIMQTWGKTKGIK